MHELLLRICENLIRSARSMIATALYGIARKIEGKPK
jgi:hypothetical protein